MARAVECLGKLLHPLASLRESVCLHRLELRLELLGGAELGEQVLPEFHGFLLQLNARLQGFLIIAHRFVKNLLTGHRAWSGCLFGFCSTHISSVLPFFVFIARAPDDSLASCWEPR